MERIKGVATASVDGGSNKIVAVEVSQNRLAAYGLTFTNVVTALASQNIMLSGGGIVRGTTEYQIRSHEYLSSIEELKGIVIRTVASGSGGGKRVINVQIVRESDSNAVQISRQVHAALEGINKSLPAGVSVEIMSDNTTLVNSTLNEVYKSALMGIILAIFILLLFLRNIKATFIIAVSIPISILITLLCMYFMGLTLNTISLTGLVMGLGMIVDASIVILDNIYHYRERGTKPRIAAILGSQEMMTAIMGSNLTTLCVFVPILLFRNDLGQMGQLFNDLVFTVCFSLAASLVVAITLVPVLCGPVMHLDTRVQKPLGNPLLKRVDDSLEKFFSAQERGYKKGLEFCLKNKLLIVGLVTVILASALLELGTFGLNLFPRSNTDDFLMESVGLSLENAKEDRKYADSRYKNGLISEEVFKEIDIAFKTTSTNQDLSAWTLKDTRNTFRLVTGLEWKTSLIPEAATFQPDAKVEDWIAKDTTLERALLTEKIASLKTATLATNASVYDRRIQETENLKAKVSVSNAQSNARRSYESAVSALRNQASLLQIRTDEYALKELAHQDALRQYERGMISLNDKNVKAIAVLTARESLEGGIKDDAESLYEDVLRMQAAWTASIEENEPRSSMAILALELSLEAAKKRGRFSLLPYLPNPRLTTSLSWDMDTKQMDWGLAVSLSYDVIDKGEKSLNALKREEYPKIIGLKLEDAKRNLADGIRKTRETLKTLDLDRKLKELDIADAQDYVTLLEKLFNGGYTSEEDLVITQIDLSVEEIGAQKIAHDILIQKLNLANYYDQEQ